MRLSRPSRRPPGSRGGLTLLEVVISLAIFLFAVTAISELLTLSMHAVVDGNLRSQAGLMCQSKLAEVTVGAESLSGSGTFDDNPGWQWTVTSEQGTLAGLWNVEVTVKKEREGLSPIEVTLRRMLFDPSLKGSTLDPPPSSTTPTGGM